jgi:hypothetical protein
LFEVLERLSAVPFGVAVGRLDPVRDVLCDLWWDLDRFDDLTEQLAKPLLAECRCCRTREGCVYGDRVRA